MFLTVFLTLYGLLHFYAFLKVQKGLALGKGPGAALAFLMFVMLMSIVMARVLEKHGMDSLSDVLALVAYMWMGALILFVSAAFALDFWGLFCTLGGRLFTRLTRWIPSPRMVFFAALFFSLAGAMYGYLEAATIRNERIVIQTAKIPKALGKLRIVQISDVHLGRMVGEKRLEGILSKVQAAGPDILVSTGDLLDGSMDDIPRMLEMFRRIPAPYGKFAIMGNHEFYVGREASIRFMRAAGFKVLRGSGVDIEDVIFVAGVDDEAGERFGRLEGESEAVLLSQATEDRFALLLKHRPHVATTGDRLFDLQLSGHTHGGQIFPFSLIIKMLYPTDAGLLKLREGAYLYVNRGAGTWGPPIRFLAPPEITVIDLVHANGTG